MANITPAADILAGGGGTYLDKDEKARLHADQTPFWITHAVAEQEGQYGVQTVFTIREKGSEDEVRLAFPANASRIQHAKKISVAIANGSDAAGPFYLGRWEKGGRSGWELTPEPTQPLTIPELSNAAAPNTAPASAPVAPTTDEDMPF